VIYIVWHYFSNGCDSWKTLHSVWVNQEDAVETEINLSLRNQDPLNVSYEWEAFEIGRDYLDIT